MRFQHLMNEVDHLRRNFSVPSAVVVLGKQTKKAISIFRFCLTIQLLPVASSSRGNSGSLCGSLCLFLVVIVFRMNNPIAKHRRGKISIFGVFKQRLPFGCKARESCC